MKRFLWASLGSSSLALVAACTIDYSGVAADLQPARPSADRDAAVSADGAASDALAGGDVAPATDSSAPTSDAPPSTPAAPSPDQLLPAGSVWRTTTEWYRPIDGAPVAEASDEMIGAIEMWGQTGIFQIDFGFSVLDGQGAPKVSFPTYEEADSEPVPIPSHGYIEGDHAYDACPGGDDCHLIVVDRGAQRLFEIYQAKKSGNTWDGYLSMWKLDRAYPAQNRGAGCTSADAAGLPILPGLIGYKETKSGAIAHALRFIMRNEFIRGVVGNRNVPNVVYPASHGTISGGAANGLPYGGRLRLKASFADDDSRVTSPGAKAIVRALKKYGMILADGGNLPLVAESVKMHADANPAETWQGLLSPQDLGFLKPTDFEVVAIPKGPPNGAAGWYRTKAEYEAQLKKPLGCVDIVQPP